MMGRSGFVCFMMVRLPLELEAEATKIPCHGHAISWQILYSSQPYRKR